MSALLLIAFVAGIASVWARGLSIDCGCFGGGGSSTDATAAYPWEIARDVGLAVLSATLAWWPVSRLSLDTLLLPPLPESRGNAMAKTNKRRDDERRSAAARKVEEMRRQQQATERRRRIIAISLSVVAVLAAVIVTAIVVQNHRTPASAPPANVPNTTSNYGVLVGQPSAPVHVIVYEDFQCPYCQAFESSSASTLKQYVADKKVSVEYRPIAFLDQNSTSQYSTRSLNAAACVTAQGGANAFVKFHELLFAHQPAEGSAGLPNSKLIQYASQAGVSGADVQSCIDNGTYDSWTVGGTDAFSKAGHTGTPTVLINGQPLTDTSSASALKAALDKAANSG